MRRRPPTDGVRHATDPELLMLHTLGLPNLAYVREQYWYHLEFQVNLALAIFVLLLTVLFSPHVYALPSAQAGIRAALSVVVLGGACWILLRAAKKNYRRHISKMCSLMVAMICKTLEDAPTKTPSKTAPSQLGGSHALIACVAAGVALIVSRRGVRGSGS